MIVWSVCGGSLTIAWPAAGGVSGPIAKPNVSAIPTPSATLLGMIDRGFISRDLRQETVVRSVRPRWAIHDRGATRRATALPRARDRYERRGAFRAGSCLLEFREKRAPRGRSPARRAAGRAAKRSSSPVSAAPARGSRSLRAEARDLHRARRPRGPGRPDWEAGCASGSFREAPGDEETRRVGRGSA